MTLKARKFLFYSLAILFVFVATTILLYSRGTIFDFRTFSFVQTGGIYIESDPPDAEIELDGKPIHNSVGILQAGTFINNLLPAKYTVTLHKDGYQSWKKEVEVLPSEVAVFDRLILLSKKESEKLEGAAEDFYESEGRIVIKNGPRLTFQDRILVGDEIVSLSTGGLIVTKDAETGNYFSSNLSALNSSLNLSLTFNNLKESALNLPGRVSLNAIYPYPYNDKKFVVRTTRGLYTMDTQRLTIELLSQNLNEFALGKSQVFWLEGNPPALLTYNLPLRTKVKLYNVPVGEKIEKIAVSPDETALALLEANGSLTLFSRDSGKVILIADKVKEFSFSPNSKVIAFVDYDGPFHLYDIAKSVYVELKTELGNIGKVEWYRDNAHLFLMSQGNLYFTEVDNEPPVNIYLIAKEIKKFIYDKNSNQVYFSTDAGLFSKEI